MIPSKIAKESEHSHQVAFFAWCVAAKMHGFEVAERWCIEGDEVLRKDSWNLKDPYRVPALEWIHAIPNGGARADDDQGRKIRGGQLKAEGVRRGVSDIFLPYPNAGWHGLYIEMKKPSQKPKTNKGRGGVSEDQEKFGKYVQKHGYGFIVCYSWREAADIVRAYIEYEVKE